MLTLKEFLKLSMKMQAYGGAILVLIPAFSISPLEWFSRLFFQATSSDFKPTSQGFPNSVKRWGVGRGGVAGGWGGWGDSPHIGGGRWD